jgi:nucleotide-binding universal stress UspA family protein
LIVAATLDPERVDRVSRRLMDSAFLGDKISDDVGETLERQCCHQAETLAAGVVAQAQQDGISAEGRVEVGNPTEICTRIARLEDIALVLVAAERQSWLTRLVSGGAVRLPELPQCEVRVIEED